VAAHLLQCKACADEVRDAKNHLTPDEIAFADEKYRENKHLLNKAKEDPEVKEILKPLLHPWYDGRSRSTESGESSRLPKEE
jgi:hypothetical protein